MRFLTPILNFVLEIRASVILHMLNIWSWWVESLTLKYILPFSFKEWLFQCLRVARGESGDKYFLHHWPFAYTFWPQLSELFAQYWLLWIIRSMLNKGYVCTCVCVHACACVCRYVCVCVLRHNYMAPQHMFLLWEISLWLNFSNSPSSLAWSCLSNTPHCVLSLRCTH